MQTAAMGPARGSEQRPRHKGLGLAEGLIWLILATLAAGVQVPGALQPSRLFIVLALLLCMGGPLAWRPVALPTQRFLVMAVLWLAWGALSLIWTPDVPNGVHELMGVLLGAVTVLVLVNLGRWARRPLEMVRLGWISAVAATIPIAVVEATLDWHMPISMGQLVVGGGDDSRLLYASTTFGNRNTYTAFLCLAFPFVLWSVSAAKTAARRGAAFLVVVFAFLVIVLNTSRLGMVVLAGETFVWLLGFVTFSRFRTVVAAAVLVSAVGYGGWKIWESRSVVRLRVAATFSGEDESMHIREALAKNGLKFIQRSAGIGLGAGSFAASVLREHRLEDTSSGDIVIVDPHNIWIEIAAQYGVIVTLLFVSWLVSCAATIRPHRFHGELAAAARYGRILLLGLPLVGLMNSAFLTFSIFWGAIGSLTVICDQVLLSRPGGALTRAGGVR